MHLKYNKENKIGNNVDKSWFKHNCVMKYSTLKPMQNKFEKLLGSVVLRIDSWSSPILFK